MSARVIIIASAMTLFAGAACAQNDEFGTLDTDNSEGLSFSEVLAVAPDLTVLDFAKFDSDASGELSKAEFAEWAAAAKSNEE